MFARKAKQSAASASHMTCGVTRRASSGANAKIGRIMKAGFRGAGTFIAGTPPVQAAMTPVRPCARVMMGKSGVGGMGNAPLP